jgi:hypothetical protein
MKTLVIGDIHNRTEMADYILQKQQYDIAIFLGDYFDSFYDNVELNTKTALWLKESLHNPKHIHLMGNHDFHYAYSKAGFCSGFTVAKYNAINSVLTCEDWKKLKYFYVNQEWWFSHAGVTKHLFQHPVLGLNQEAVESRLSRDQILLESGQFPESIYAASYRRGGRHVRGGILWNDWSELDLINNIKQIVGHTPHKTVQRRKSLAYPGADLYCIDTELTQYITIEDKFVSIHNTNYEHST